VAERVEVGAQLLRARHLLGDPVHAVVPETVAVAVVGGGHEGLAEVAPREDRNRLVEHAPEVIQTAMADEPERLTAPGLVDVVEHPELVVRAELTRPPGLGYTGFDRGLGVGAHSEEKGVEKLGNSVRPPSTKIVWPVM
jgi:hypothetical protein